MPSDAITVFSVCKNFLVSILAIKFPGIGISMGSILIAIFGLPILFKAGLSIFSHSSKGDE